MNSLRDYSRRIPRPRGIDGEQISRAGQFAWALAAIAVIAVLAVVSLVLVVSPPGQKRYTAKFPEAGTVVAGNEVRIAGVTVGRVLAVDLAADAGSVLVTFAVDTGVAVGSDSSIDVRMSTPVGGNYLALTSSGSTPLGAFPIPADRVNLPYQVSQILPDATKVVDRFDTVSLRKTISDASAAIRQVSPSRTSDALTGVEKLTKVFEAQSRSIEQMIALANDYIRTATANRQTIDAVLDTIVVAVQALYPYRNNVPTVLAAANKLIIPIGVLGREGLNDRMVPVGRALVSAQDAMSGKVAELDQAMGSLVKLMEQLSTVGTGGRANIDLAKTMVQLSQACVPTANRTC